jgi:transcriptional regulator GlxA family with amidase domain
VVAMSLVGKPVYSVEIATNGNDLKVEGEGDLLSFLAHGRDTDLKAGFDSLLLVCGVATRDARDPKLFAFMRSVAPRVRRLGSVCVGSFLLAEAGLRLLERRCHETCLPAHIANDPAELPPQSPRSLMCAQLPLIQPRQ